MIKLDSTVTAQYAYLAQPPTHAEIFHRAVSAPKLPVNEWAGLKYPKIDAAYHLGALDSSGAFVPSPHVPVILASIDLDAPLAQNVLGAGAAPDPKNPRATVAVPGKPAGDCRTCDLDAIFSVHDQRLLGTVI